MKIAIYFQESTLKDGRTGYRWAWKESRDVNVFGWMSSLDEIRSRAAKMFPGNTFELTAF